MINKVGQRTHGPRRGMRPIVIFVAVLLAFVAVLPLSAHGGGKQQLTGQELGPFRVYVWTSPEPWRVGQAHTTVAVTQALDDQQETPVSGAQVWVTYRQAGAGMPSERVVAVEQTGAQAGFYEADGAVGAVGDWQIIVEVAGPQGEGTTTFIESVLPANEFNWWLIGGGVLVALLAVGYVGTRKAGVRPVQRGASL
jgi:hypothetical protein